MRRSLPLTEDAEAFEFFTLDGDEFLRVSPASSPEFEFVRSPALVFHAGGHLMFDGHAVAIPARNIGHVQILHGFGFDDNVL